MHHAWCDGMQQAGTVVPPQSSSSADMQVQFCGSTAHPQLHLCMRFYVHKLNTQHIVMASTGQSMQVSAPVVRMCPVSCRTCTTTLTRHTLAEAPCARCSSPCQITQCTLHLQMNLKKLPPVVPCPLSRLFQTRLAVCGVGWMVGCTMIIHNLAHCLWCQTD